MPKHYLTVRCTEENCKECSHYVYNNRRDYSEAVIKHKNYKCLRHSDSKKDELLSIYDKCKEKTLINTKSPTNGGLFWADEQGRLQSGYQHGPGFQLWSKDFPEGAILKVTAEIILP